MLVNGGEGLLERNMKSDWLRGYIESIDEFNSTGIRRSCRDTYPTK